MYTILALCLCLFTFGLSGQPVSLPHLDALSPPQVNFRPLYWEALRYLLPPRLQPQNFLKIVESQENSRKSHMDGTADFLQEESGIFTGKSRKFKALIRQHARKNGIDEKLVRALIDLESDFNPRAVSPEGAKGLMQLMPRTARLVGVRNPLDARQNIAGGVIYLRICLEQFNQDPVLALAAYNAGPDNVVKYHGCPPFKETRRFVAQVMKKCYGRDWRKHRKAKPPKAAYSLGQTDNGAAQDPREPLGSS
jgi:soluble lytic murein transglycosylase-like protein